MNITIFKNYKYLNRQSLGLRIGKRCVMAARSRSKEEIIKNHDIILVNIKEKAKQAAKGEFRGSPIPNDYSG